MSPTAPCGTIPTPCQKKLQRFPSRISVLCQKTSSTSPLDRRPVIAKKKHSAKNAAPAPSSPSSPSLQPLHPKTAPKQGRGRPRRPQQAPGGQRMPRSHKAPRPQIRPRASRGSPLPPSPPPFQNKNVVPKKRVSVKTFRSKLSLKTLLGPKPYTISINPKP